MIFQSRIRGLRKEMKVDDGKLKTFAISMETECYCGKKIKIEYDEGANIKNTKCPYCSYSHLDIVYTWRKEAELHTTNFLKSFFK